MTARSRAGAALVLALILLVALLLLGLPFLFTQSSSLSGVRSFSDHRQAQIGRDSAASLAAAAAAYAMTPYLRAPTPTPPPNDLVESWTDLTAAFAPPNPDTLPAWKSAVKPLEQNAGGSSADDRSVIIQPDGLNLGFNEPPTATAKQRTYLGAVVTDESGKLDPNSMGPVLWQDLLRAVGIDDWDDNDVYDPPPAPPPGQPYPPGTYFPDSDAIGQLAQALASERFNRREGVITSLEQLLEPNPQDAEPGSPKRLRWRLTRAELDRLRPYLTLHSLPQGRGGLIDLGTVVMEDPAHNTSWLDCVPEQDWAIALPPSNQATVLHPLLGIGTLLVSEATRAQDPSKKPLPVPPHRMGLVNGPDEAGDSAYEVLGRSVWLAPDYAGAGPPANLAAKDQAICIGAPAPLNAHQLSNVVRQALANARLEGTAFVPNGAPALPSDLPGTPSIDESVLRGITALAAVQIPNVAKPPGTGSLSPQPTFFDLIDPTRTGNEVPPLGIASAGIFSIDAAATITDALGRQTAQEFRRDVVQAVPQEYLLERRWLTQGPMAATIAQRYGSHVQSWPVAFERRSSAPPDDPDPANPALLPAKNTGIRQRPLPDICLLPQAPVSNSPGTIYLQHIKLDWRADFGADQAKPDATVLNAECATAGVWADAGAPSAPPTSPNGTVAPDATYVRPDGYYHEWDGSRQDALAYPLADATAARPTAMFIERQGDPAHEMGARHVSLWVRPEADWTSGVYPLLESRIAKTAPAPQWDGTVGSTDSQNYLGLWYDATNELLVLALAPPSIENTVDYAKHPPAANAIAMLPDDPATSLVDERSDPDLSGAFLLAPKQPDAASLAPFTPLFQPNRALHVFSTHLGGEAFFRRFQWHHLELAIASDRPDGVSIIVDGEVGQDIMKTSPGSPKIAGFGDHCTLPSMTLKTALPALSLTPTEAEIYLPTIELAVPQPRSGSVDATAFLPAHGLVRIDDEYIWYDSISGSTLNGCVRGQRQDTWAAANRLPPSAPTPIPPQQQWPSLQAHAIGALVTAGGYRIATAPGNGAVGAILQGGATLHEAVPPLKVTDGPMRNPLGRDWTIWGRMALSAGPTFTTTATSIPLDIGRPLSLWPSRGIVSVSSPGLPPQYIYYGAIAAGSPPSLTGLMKINTWAVASSPWQGQWNNDLPVTPGNQPTVVLVSIACKDQDPTDPAHYAQDVTAPSFQFDRMIQVRDPVSARIEWFSYDDAIQDKSGVADGKGFFISRRGFDYTATVNDPLGGSLVLGDIGQSRGMCRTDFVGKAGSWLAGQGLDSGAPAGCYIIPVQTELSNPAHWIATGDVITLRPHDPAKPAVQMVVRYAGNDGWPEVAPLFANDSRNELFTFDTTTNLLPPALADFAWADYDLLCGNCWSADDLTPAKDGSGNPTRSPQPRGHLPRIDLWNDGATPARVYLGSTDPDRAPTTAGSDCSFDCLSAGGLTVAGPALDAHETVGQPQNSTQCGIEWFFKDGDISLLLNAGDSLSGNLWIVEATRPIFTTTLGKMGLVEIDGEVFAYRQATLAELQPVAQTLEKLRNGSYAGYAPYPNIAAGPITVQALQNDARFAVLTARGLLDELSGGLDHQIAADGPVLYDGLPHHPILPAKRLPLGPVLRLNDTVQSSQWFGLSDSTAITALDAPAALFCSSDGTQANQEVLQLIGPKYHRYPLSSPPNPPDLDVLKYTTADWLRGLYRTDGSLAWAGGTTNAAPVVIGWWPRYASALPNQTAAIATEAKRLRCRTYGWMGFPFSLVGAYFDTNLVAKLPAPYGPSGSNPGLPLADMLVEAPSLFPDSNGAPYFQVEARALAIEQTWTGPGTPAMDWSLQQPVLVTGSATTTPQDLSAVFASAHDGAGCFSQGGKPIPADGAELRVSWRYAQALAGSALTLHDIAAAGARTPVIDQAHLRCLAPVRVLATEHAR